MLKGFKIEIFTGSRISKFLRWGNLMMILNSSKTLGKPLVMAKLTMAYL